VDPARAQLIQQLQDAKTSGDMNRMASLVQQIQGFDANPNAGAKDSDIESAFPSNQSSAGNQPAPSAQGDSDIESAFPSNQTGASTQAQPPAASPAQASVDKMSLLDQITNSMGVQVDKWGQAAQQMYGHLFNDQDLLNSVAQQQAHDKAYQTALGNTWGGKLGGVGMDIAGASIPIAGMEAGGVGLASSGVAPRVAALLQQPAVQGAVANGMSSAFDPTMGPNGSRANNVLWGTALGAGVPLGLRYGPGLAAKFIPGIAPAASATAPLVKALIARIGQSASNVGAAAENAAGAIGKKMGAITDNLSVPMGNDVANQAAYIKTGWGGGLSDDANNALNRLQYATNVPGKVLADMRSSAYSAAQAAARTNPQVAKGYYAIQQLADNQIDNHLNSFAPTVSEMRFGQTKAQQLRLLRAAYGTAKGGTPVNPNTITAADAAANIPLTNKLPLQTGVGVEQQFQQNQQQNQQ
jgi:hypothetical protein